MNFIHTLLLGITEGITEFLPISSTAHLDIMRNFLQIPTTEFVKSFMIAIQLGAILAIVLLYAKKIISSSRYFFNICIAFIPTGVIGFILYKIIKAFLLGNVVLAVVMLVLGGVIILIFEHRQKNGSYVSTETTIENMSVRELVLLGCIQALAVVPGVSRSGAVIIGGRMLGFRNDVIVEFSFLLAVPTMLAATSYDLLKSGFAFTSSDWGTMLLGFIVSMITAIFVVKWLVHYVQNNSFAVFGWYRVIVGIILLTLYLI